MAPIKPRAQNTASERPSWAWFNERPPVSCGSTRLWSTVIGSPS